MADTPSVPVTQTTWAEALRNIANTVNAMLTGKLNCVGTVTLTASDTTTTVTDKRVTATSHISLTPLTANAVADAPSCYISTRTAGASFVITHPSDADTDKDFTYSILG